MPEWTSVLLLKSFRCFQSPLGEIAYFSMKSMPSHCLLHLFLSSLIFVIDSVIYILFTPNSAPSETYCDSCTSSAFYLEALSASSPQPVLFLLYGWPPLAHYLLGMSLCVWAQQASLKCSKPIIALPRGIVGFYVYFYYQTLHLSCEDTESGSFSH